MWVAVGLWCMMRRAYVRPRLLQEAHRVRLARRHVGKLCEVVRVRRMLRRRLVWLQVLRW